MAVSIEMLRGFAAQLNLPYKEVEIEDSPMLAIDVPTQTPEGTQDVTVLVRSYDQGEMFEATVAGLLPTELHQESEHKLHFLFYLLHKAWRTKFGTPEVDKDGEVRLLVEIPLADAVMTVKQFERILLAATRTAVEIAVEGAQILLHGGPREAARSDGATPLQDLMAEMVRMQGSAEGRVKLGLMAGDSELPEQIRDIAQRLLGSTSQPPDSL